MHELDLTSETVTTNAGRCVVAAAMLAPADDALRHEIETFERLAGLADHAETVDAIPGDHAARMARYALAIRSHAEIVAEVHCLTVRGMRSGSPWQKAGRPRRRRRCVHIDRSRAASGRF